MYWTLTCTRASHVNIHLIRDVRLQSSNTDRFSCIVARGTERLCQVDGACSVHYMTSLTPTDHDKQLPFMQR